MADLGSVLVANVRALLGDPYVYGKAGPSQFDCSGLMQYVAGAAGIKLPRTSEEQYRVGQPVTAAQLAPGDLVFSAGSDGTAANPGHVGMYIGAGQVVAAPYPGKDVEIEALSGFDAVGYRRITGLGGAQTASFIDPINPLDPFNYGSGGGPGGTGGLGGLLSIPQDIVNFFSKGYDDLVAVGAWLTRLFLPSTWVRVGSGLFGLLFLGVGMVFLVRETKAGA